MDTSWKLTLQTPDYVVFVGMFVTTMAIGIWYALAGQRAMSRESYFVGDRKMHFIPVALSLLVTYESSIMMLGLPAEVYLFGVGVIVIAFSHLLAHVLHAFIIVPLIKPLNITSIYEWVDKRYRSRGIRTCGVLLSLIGTLFYMSIVLYAQAVAMEATVGLNMWISIFAMDVCAVIYTSLGGIKSVVWTDVFQAIIMLAGIFAVIIKGTIDTGGVYKVWEYANSGGRLTVFDFDPDPTTRHTVWTMLLPKIVTAFGFGFAQGVVQRISASDSIVGARRMILFAAPLYLFIYVIVVVEGVVVYSFFRQRDIEPFSCGLIKNPNQILPYAVLVMFEKVPGVAGLFMAALCSASLSTISSGFSGMSILLMEDLFQPLLKHTSDARATLYAKISVVFLGVLSVIFCIVVTYVEGPLHQICTSLLSASSAPLTGIFMLGCFFPSVNKKGAIIGLVFGFVVSGTLTIGGNFSPNVRKPTVLPLGDGTCGEAVVSNLTSVVIDNLSNTTSMPAYNTTIGIVEDYTKSYNKFFSLSYLLFSPCGIITTVIVGLLATYVLGRNRPGDVDPKYFLEVSDSLLICLPSRLRRWLKSIGPQYKAGLKGAPKEDGITTTELFPVAQRENQEKLQCSEELI